MDSGHDTCIVYIYKKIIFCTLSMLIYDSLSKLLFFKLFFFISLPMEGEGRDKCKVDGKPYPL